MKPSRAGRSCDCEGDQLGAYLRDQTKQKYVVLFCVLLFSTMWAVVRLTSEEEENACVSANQTQPFPYITSASLKLEINRDDRPRSS